MQILRNRFIFVLLALYAIPRLLILRAHSVAFSFDHGKDSLAVMHLLLTQSPKLIGPWTSIPGLYFGPGWYYLLAPAFMLTNFHPLAGTITMVILGALQVWVVYRFFGKLPALVVATTPFWLATTSSAWNPFPITLTTWIVLLCLHLLQTQPQKLKIWLGLGLAAGFGFHFSTAFAVLYAPFIAFGLLVRQVKLSWQRVVVLIIGSGLPFIPQAIFELRHQFVELRGVAAYLTGAVQIETSMAPTSWLEVLKSTLFQMQSATMPDITGRPLEKNLELLMLLTLCIWALVKLVKAMMQASGGWRTSGKRSAIVKTLLIKHQLTLEFLFWILVSSVWFYKLHFNTWYLYGLMPLMVLFFTHQLRRWPDAFKNSIVLLLMLTPLALSVRFVRSDRAVQSTLTMFLPIKEQVVETIYTKAGDRPFAVYHYEPAIYDFAYQYLFFSAARRGRRLPTEFSYQPGVPTYIVEKPELLQAFAKQIDTRPPELVFFVVESAQVDALQEEWWHHQHYSQIIETIEVTKDLHILVALP